MSELFVTYYLKGVADIDPKNEAAADPAKVDADYAFQGEYAGLLAGQFDVGAQVIALGDILSSREASQATHPLEVAIGRDINGKNVMVNLATMPHVLIAGATGAGRGVLEGPEESQGNERKLVGP